MPRYASTAGLNLMIKEAQEAALQPDRWPRFCELLSDSLGGGTIALHFDCISPIGKSENLNAVSYGIDDTAVGAYADHYRNVDLISVGSDTVQVGETAFAPHSRSEVERSEFFGDWMLPMGLRPSGSFLTVLSKEHGLPKAAIGSYQNQDSPEWGNDLISWMDELTPHIQHAVRVSGRILELESREHQLRGVLDSLRTGFALLDENRQIVFMNPAFAKLSLTTDGIGSENRKLRAAHPSEDKALQQALASALVRRKGANRSVSSISIASPLHSLPLVAQVFPLEGNTVDEWTNDFPKASAGVWTMDLSTRHPAPSDLLSLAFSLTPAETRAATLLSEGISPNEIADRLGITVNSAREYTKRVMSKTGTRRQPELVRLLRSIIPPGAPSEIP